MMSGVIRRKRILAVLLVVAALAITGSVWATTAGTGGFSISQGGVGGKLASVTAASASTQFLRFGDYENGTPLYASPDWLRTNGDLDDIERPGDLFYIDTTGNPGDVVVWVYWTNMGDIIKRYGHILVKLNFYKLATATDQRIGTGDGVEEHFYTASLPVVPSSETVYVGGVAKTRNTHYTIDYEKGKIKFLGANIPANGAAISITYQYWTQATWQGSYASVSNEAVGTGDGSHKNFALAHEKVIPDSETVYVNGVLQNRSKTADYRMDYDDGVIKFNDSSKPGVGTAIVASYKYYTEVAFRGDSTRISNETVGTGNGTQKKYDLGHTAIVSESDTIYVAGVAQTRDIDYTIDYDHGDIKFATAPANGAAITASYRYWTVQGTEIFLHSPGKLLAPSLGYTSFILEGNTKYDLAVIDAQFHGHKKGYEGGTDAPSFFIDVRAR